MTAGCRRIERTPDSVMTTGNLNAQLVYLLSPDTPGGRGYNVNR